MDTPVRLSMNWIHFWILPAAFYYNFCDAAASKKFRSSSTKKISAQVSKFDLLSDDLIFEIGEYLVFPQREMGFVNKKLFNTFFKVYPFSRLIGIRYNIPEFINSKYSQDLVPFIPIPLIKDEIHIFFTVTTAIFVHEQFYYNKKALLGYLFRLYSSFSSELPSKPEVVRSAISEKVILFVKALMKEQFYEYALIIMKSNLRMVSVVFKNSFDLYDAINFASYIKTSNSFVDFILILNSINDTLLKSILIAGGILQKVPEILYRDTLFSNPEIVRDVVAELCVKFIPIPIDFDIYSFISRILKIAHERNIREVTIKSLDMLNRIRFGSETKKQLRTELKKNYDYVGAYIYFLCASCQAEKIGLARSILSMIHSFRYIPFNCFSESTIGFKFVTMLPDLINEFGIYFDRSYFYRAFVSRYKILRVKYDKKSRLIRVKMQRICYETNVPEFFEYKMADRAKAIEVLIYSYYENYKCHGSFEENENRLLSTTMQFLKIPNAIKFFDRCHDAIIISADALKIIAESSQLLDLFRNLDTEFTIDSKYASKIFEKPAHQLSRILLIDSVDIALRSCTTHTQIANFEAFTGRIVADWMEKYIELDTEDSLAVFFDYSAVFHYWFNGPHRDRLMNYLTNEYLTLLAEEMDPESANYIGEFIKRRS